VADPYRPSRDIAELLRRIAHRLHLGATTAPTPARWPLPVLARLGSIALRSSSTASRRRSLSTRRSCVRSATRHVRASSRTRTS
jgi:hypothetical protein